MFKIKCLVPACRILFLIMILLLPACSLKKAQQGIPTQTLTKPITLKLAHIYSSDHPFSAGMSKIAERIKARTEGKLIINTYDSGILGNENEIVDSIINGIIDIAIVGPGELGKKFKPVLIFDAPYVFKGVDHMQRITDGQVGEELWEQMSRDAGIKILTSLYYGTRHITTSNVTIKTPADLKGIKLRTPDQPLSIANARAMGAIPVPMALYEVYLALQQGIVDGQENPIPTIASQKLNEVQKYLNLTSHVIQVTPVVISVKKMETLPIDLKAVLIEAFREAGPEINMEIVKKERADLEDLKKNGMAVIYSDKDAFREATKPVIRDFEKIWGKGLYEKIQAVD